MKIVQLNEYDSKNMRLMDIIESNTKKVTNIHTKLEAGDCVILLDAMDEIKSTEFSNFSKELNRFANDYPDNLYIIYGLQPCSIYTETSGGND